MDAEQCGAPRDETMRGPFGCAGLVSGYLDGPPPFEHMPVCAMHARAFAAAAIELGFVPEIGGMIAGELRERGLPRRVVEALERRKQRLAARAG